MKCWNAETKADNKDNTIVSSRGPSNSSDPITNRHSIISSRVSRRKIKSDFSLILFVIEAQPNQRNTANMRGPPQQNQPMRSSVMGVPQNSQNANNPPTAQKRARWFVALFDYDPATMSPNPDACDEELPFTEGDSIKVWGDKDADGFYWGECRGKPDDRKIVLRRIICRYYLHNAMIYYEFARNTGRKGFVPHNMVMEVEGSQNRDRWGDIYSNSPVKKMVALYDYDPQELSPNVDAEVRS